MFKKRVARFTTVAQFTPRPTRTAAERSGLFVGKSAEFTDFKLESPDSDLDRRTNLESKVNGKSF